jgi:hypothetical protein
MDIVAVAYPSARKLDLNTKQNTSHKMTPLLPPKNFLLHLCNRRLWKHSHPSAASAFWEVRRTCVRSAHFPGNSANTCSQIALDPSDYLFLVTDHGPGHERAIVRQLLAICDKRPVSLNRRLKLLTCRSVLVATAEKPTPVRYNLCPDILLTTLH